MRKANALLILCLALIFASTVRAQNAPGVNDAELNGNYALAFNGIAGNSTGSVALAFVGRFTADGAGKLTNGELDSNSAAVGDVLTAQPFIGTYSIGSDHRGVMTLNVGGTLLHLALAMMASGNAQFIEFDATGGAGIVGSGTIEKSDATAYSTAKITGDYAFGAAGLDNANNRAAIAGRFTSNGTGTLTNVAGDVDAYGTDYAMNFTAATYTVSSSASGRGALHIAFTFGGAPDTMNFVFYVVNSGKLFVMESDAVTPATPLLNGAVLQQRVPAGGFSNASLNGNMVIELSGLSLCGGPSRIPKAVAGLLTTNGNGALSLTYDENYCSAPNSVTGAAGTYTVTSNGRSAIMIGGYSLVAYLIGTNQIFLFVSDSNVLFGLGEPQTASPLTNAAVTGAYAGLATNPVAFGVHVFSGEFSADGASPTGHLSGSVDIGDSGGPVSGAPFATTYSVTASPTNGRGIVTLTSPSAGSAIAYVVSPTKFVVVPMSDPHPAVWVFERAPTSTPTLSLSSLALSPTGVIGGAQSSTGRVTLSGAAPSGGAQVSLSSSNTAAASVPSSVTVPAGATTVGFTASTSVVSASTAVTISASYAGATKTTLLTVSPTPPPPVSLSMLTLSPPSVIGGVQSSTGTLTLSSPAPSGGVQVLLSSSNGSASVPSSVIVPAGTRSASFSIHTSVVLISTSALISASYNGTTKTANLAVLL